MRPIRLSAAIVLTLVAIFLSGCAGDPGWPAGTKAVVASPNGRAVSAQTLRDQTGKINRRAVSIANQTPVVSVDDQAFRRSLADPTRAPSPGDPVRVRIVTGDRQWIEVVVRRRDLAPMPNAGAAQSMYGPIAIVLLILLALTLWSLETLVRLILRMRDQRRCELLAAPFGQRLETPRAVRASKSRLAERTDQECEQWCEWIEGINHRRKARCERLARFRAQSDLSRRTSA
jgi:hypothetical protein